MKKKRVAIIAPTGMLGSMVYREFKDHYDLVLVYRDAQKLTELNTIYGGVHQHKRVTFNLGNIQKNFKNLVSAIGAVDAVINCAGITKPHSLNDPYITVLINSTLPHMVSDVYKERLIQITTDCAFDGRQGAPYNEDSPKTANDLYGLSKSLGEPSESLVLRTSIIGPEITGHSMLLDWFLREEGKTISGFTNHLWNGITTKEFARICRRIIDHRSTYPKHGIFHIFSTSITKYDMLAAFKKKYGTRVSIKRVAAPERIDRRLTSKFSLCAKLHIPSFSEMLRAL